MKKRVFALFLALVLCLGLIPAAQATEEEVTWTITELVPIGKYDADFADFNFSDGLAMVYRDGKYGYIDKTGVEIIPCKYVSADSFSEGLAPVCLGDWEARKWGMIDKTGTEVVLCKNNYNLVESFHHGLALVWNEDLCRGFIDKTGTEIVPCKYRGWGGDSYSWSEGFMVVEDKNWNRGFVDTTGKEIVPCKYEVACSFSEGLAAVELHGKWGYIDTTGAEVVPCKYSSAANYSEGLAAVELNGKYGYIDKTGTEVISCKYDTGDDFFEGLAVVGIGDWETRKYGYIDKMGRVVVPLKYDWAGPFSEGLAAVELHGKCGHIDTTGAEVVPCKYDFVGDFSEGLALVYLGDGDVGKHGYIDKAGQEIVPCNYDEAYGFSFGLGAVWQDGKLGFVDTAGNEVIPCTLECDICSFVEEGLVSIGRERSRERGGAINYEYGLFSVTRTIAQINSGCMEGEGKNLDWTCSETGQVKVSGELAEDEVVLAASYDDQGRLTELKLLARDALTAKLKEGADKIKLFWLGAKQNPLSASATVWGE